MAAMAVEDPLFNAVASESHTEVMKLLLEEGANLDCANPAHVTALIFFTLKKPSAPRAQLLPDYGDHPSLVMNSTPPLDVATSESSAEHVAMTEKAISLYSPGMSKYKGSVVSTPVATASGIEVNLLD